MNKQKLISSPNPVLAAVGSLFTEAQLTGHAMPLHHYPTPIAASHMLFDKRMADVGWMREQAWSTWFIEIVYTHAMQAYPTHAKALTHIFSGSATDAFRRFCISFMYRQVSVPVPGAIAFYQVGNSWMGHAAIVLKKHSANRFICIEATNPTGKADGFALSLKTRSHSIYPNTNNTNPITHNLLGYIVPTPNHQPSQN